ncbi:HesA/MoeB/ThiF family protein [Cochlodiniinecator piscidefendens]|uniref:HesA/MoeB/ThiF family protein n=1 Tax=Cochlodiniinecator piscidefendens TaxID=2715756 RepID=UPI00140A735D|nr:molybdopterin-synthase adenylyltransferase MoeB [Cochlodiniinecator piscidefendens]
MGFFVFASAILFGVGMMTGAPMRMRFYMILMLYLGIVLALVVLPEDSSLRLTFGGTLGEWVVAGGVGLAIAGYVALLKRVKRRVAPDEAPISEPTDKLSDAEVERYARHIILREIGGAGQKRLKLSRVLVVGAGGLGSPALMYLAAAGVGTIGVVDDDVVDHSNLQRQVIHDDTTIDQPKVHSAANRMRALNPFITVKPYQTRLSEDQALELIAEYDLVLDGTDNFDTRYLVNKVCSQLNKPLIAAALTQWEGQISLYDPANGTPCYQCIFPEAPASHLAPSCAEAGVLGPLPGVIGSMMAVEAVKYIAPAGSSLTNTMLIYDALYSETRQIHLKPRKDCPICQQRLQPVTEPS